jgi:hypothetical protein
MLSLNLGSFVRSFVRCGRGSSRRRRLAPRCAVESLELRYMLSGGSISQAEVLLADGSSLIAIDNEQMSPVGLRPHDMNVPILKFTISVASGRIDENRFFQLSDLYFIASTQSDSLAETVLWTDVRQDSDNDGEYDRYLGTVAPNNDLIAFDNGFRRGVFFGYNHPAHLELTVTMGTSLYGLGVGVELVQADVQTLAGNPVSQRDIGYNGTEDPTIFPLIVPESDVSVTASGPITASVNSSVMYDVSVNNIGRDDPELVTIYFTPASGLIFEAADSFAYVDQFGAVVIDVGSMTNDERKTFTLTFEVTSHSAGMTEVSYVSVMSSNYDNNFANNFCSISTIISS